MLEVTEYAYQCVPLRQGRLFRHSHLDQIHLKTLLLPPCSYVKITWAVWYASIRRRYAAIRYRLELFSLAVLFHFAEYDHIFMHMSS